MESIMIKAINETTSGGKSHEIRRFPGGETPAYTSIHDKVTQVFPALKERKFNIYWKDEDGDRVLVSSQDEMTEALTSVQKNVLKLYITGDTDLNCEMDNMTLDPGYEGWSRGWGRRGPFRGRGTKRAWRWNPSGMPMQAIPPHVLPHWIKRSLKRSHKMGKGRSRPEGRTCCMLQQKDATGGDENVHEINKDTSEMHTDTDVITDAEMTTRSIDKRQHSCHRKCPEHDADNTSSSASSDEGTPPDAEYHGPPERFHTDLSDMIPGGLPGMFPAVLPGFWGVMGPHPLHPPLLGPHYWPVGGFHEFHPRHDAETNEVCMGARARFRCHQNGKRKGRRHRRRCQGENEAEKENAEGDSCTPRATDKYQDDVIIMEDLI